MKIGNHIISVCSWSIHPKSTQELIDSVHQLGLEHVQLALGELARMDDKRRHGELAILRGSGLKFSGGMIGFPGEDYTSIATIKQTGGFVSAEEFDLRRQITRSAAQVAKELGMTLLTAHIGFVPPSNDPNYHAMTDRICAIATDLQALGLILTMETGQEAAPELLQFLNDLRCQNVKINFDPANMILYGAGDPIEAIGILGRHVAHVHVKDAILSEKPGNIWGKEVPFGTGQVPPREFLAGLKSVGYTGALAIEREAGETRMADIAFAIETLRKAAE